MVGPVGSSASLSEISSKLPPTSPKISASCSLPTNFDGASRGA